jgi:hypothetical protein
MTNCRLEPVLGGDAEWLLDDEYRKHAKLVWRLGRSSWAAIKLHENSSSSTLVHSNDRLIEQSTLDAIFASTRFLSKAHIGPASILHFSISHSCRDRHTN